MMRDLRTSIISTSNSAKNVHEHWDRLESAGRCNRGAAVKVDTIGN